MFRAAQNFFAKTRISLKLLIMPLLFLTLLLTSAFFVFKTPKTDFVSEKLNQEEIKVFNLSGVISSVDSGNNFIIIKAPVNNQDIKVILREDSKIFKLELLERGEVISPQPVPITINDLKAGSHAFVESDENIYQKTEFDGIIKIQILP